MAEPVKLPSGEVQNFTIRIGGSLARCPACNWGNVFHKPDNTRLDLYECNACGARCTGE